MLIKEYGKENLMAEFKKAWTDQSMVDYCTKKVASVAVLSDSEIITVDKQSIETRFCFGESGYDYDDAASMAEHARQSESYFKAENMKDFNEWIKDLDDVLNNHGRYRLVIHQRQYCGQTADCKLRSIAFEKDFDIIDALGGSVMWDDIPGAEITIHGRQVRVATAEEVNKIKEAYVQAAKMHEKKIDNYLKRYGLSKVHTWTYWRDA